MFIRKKLPKPHAPGEPILHQDHKRPITRRELLGAGLMSAPAVVLAPAWLGALLKSGNAEAALPVSPDIQNLYSGCGINPLQGIPFICFDLAGGANLLGSEALIGVKGGQSNFLSTAGYGKLGVPGNMVPTSSTFISSALGLLWHSDGAILRGIQTKASAATQAATNGAVIAAISQNDTGVNPHNPMYGIAMTGANGKLLNLIGTQSTVSGGNSAAPMNMINPQYQPTTIAQPSDDTGLVSTGGGTADAVSIAMLEAQVNMSAGTDPANFQGMLAPPSGGTAGTTLVAGSGNATLDSALKSQVRCAYVKNVYSTSEFSNPAVLDPTQDTLITGGSSPIFTASDFNDGDIRKTASVMKLVLNKYAAAGTITLGGYDYHDSTRATGELRNFKAGQMIGAVLEYARRVNTPVMIYVFSDGSLSSSAMVDTSANGRDKLAWQGDNESVAGTFFLVYSPNGRPQLLNGGSGQQIGWFTSDGSVDTTSSPAANSVQQLVELVCLNYMALQGNAGLFGTKFPKQGLGSTAAQTALTAFAPIA